MTTPKQITIHAVLAGAYKGKRASLKATLIHASCDGGDNALCGSVKQGNLCDEYGTEPNTPVTCPTCIRWVTAIQKAGGRIKAL